MTEKQRRWQERSRILWRLKGMYIVTASSNNILTATETEKISQAMTLIRDVVGNSTQSSRELGFDAVERCRICGKPVYKNGLCKKCNELRSY